MRAGGVSIRGVSRLFRLGRRLLWLNIIALGVFGGWYLFQPDGRQREVAQLVHNAFIAEKHVSPFEVVWDIWQLYYGDDSTAALRLNADRRLAIGGLPDSTAFHHGKVRVLMNSAYVVGYSETLCGPVWAAYRIQDLDRLEPAPPRPDHFEIDMRTLARVSPEAYRESHYDRGHLAPNHGIATRFGEAAQRETFLMSNIVPQSHELNAGLWKELEQRIAGNYPARYGEVWVFCGPIFPENPRRLSRRVAIPDRFFMIILDEVEGRLRSQAFVLPQDAPAGASLAAYGTSIDRIEEMTGLDFLSELDPQSVAALEAKVTRTPW